MADLTFQYDGGVPVRERVNFGQFPIMLKSKLCHLAGSDPRKLVQCKEEASEMGGYFITNGLERVIRLLILPKRNYPMSMVRNSFRERRERYTDKAVAIRCVREDQSAVTVKLYYLNNGSARLGFCIQWREYLLPVGIILKGPLLLAPTGSDLKRHGQLGTVFAGYHYDLNFLTIHGRSRFPGLHIWLKNGQKMQVKVPVGCLLVQTGKQIEWLTAGECIAGMHEVVVTERTIDAIKSASEQNHSLWRVSSTLFAHIASDALLKPLGHFSKSPLANNYPAMPAGEFVEQELAAINLKGTSDGSAK